MFARRRLMVQSAAAVSAVTAVSSSFGLFATALAGRLLQLSWPVRVAALPRQVTVRTAAADGRSMHSPCAPQPSPSCAACHAQAPLAIAIAGMLQADPSLAATIVVVTGLLAANFGRAVLDALGVDSPVARGLAMGAAGHGLGTAAMAAEAEAFPFAAIAMALNAALSTVLVSVPFVRKLLLAAAGGGP
jgi:putative effector of murein hydrolase